jgi:hypothetical protein
MRFRRVPRSSTILNMTVVSCECSSEEHVGCLLVCRHIGQSGHEAQGQAWQLYENQSQNYKNKQVEYLATNRIMGMEGGGYQETPLTLVEITLFILTVGDCVCACTRHSLP